MRHQCKANETSPQLTFQQSCLPACLPACPMFVGWAGGRVRAGGRVAAGREWAGGRAAAVLAAGDGDAGEPVGRGVPLPALHGAQARPMRPAVPGRRFRGAPLPCHVAAGPGFCAGVWAPPGAEDVAVHQSAAVHPPGGRAVPLPAGRPGVPLFGDVRLVGVPDVHVPLLLCHLLESVHSPGEVRQGGGVPARLARVGARTATTGPTCRL
eukprot:jgi/Mesen1/9831/ME000007S09881